MNKIHIILYLLFLIVGCGQITTTSHEDSKKSKALAERKSNNPVDTIPFDQLTADPIKILSLNAGGVRGIMTAALLEGLEEATGKSASQLFDIIAGTASGGTIALAVTSQKNNQNITAKEIKEFLVNNAKEIFNPNPLEPGKPEPQPGEPIIKPVEAFKGALIKLFDDHLFKDLTRPVVLPIIDINASRGLILQSNNKRLDNLQILDAAWATFTRDNDIVDLKDNSGNLSKHNIRGGEWYKSNPALLAYDEAESLYGNAALKQRGIILISLGAGHPVEKSSYGQDSLDAGGLWWLNKIENLMAEVSTSEDKEIINSLFKGLPHSKLIRIEPNIDSKVHPGIESTNNVAKDNINNLLHIAEEKKKSADFTAAIELLKSLPESKSEKINKPAREEPIKELSDPIKILSMDGGGIRGVMIASLLEGFEKATGKKSYQMFDLVAGTSTGGLIALGLTTPKDNTNEPAMSASELKNLYLTKGSVIFTKSGGFFTRGPDYKTKPLEDLIKQMVGEKLFKDLLKTTLITAVDVDGRKGYALESDKASFNHLSLVEVGRATSAAPTYFGSQAMKLKTDQGEVTGYMVDGGLYKNNPSLLAYYKAKSMFGDEAIKKRGVLLISLGTGNFLAPIKYDFIGGTTKAAVDLLFNVTTNEDQETLQDIFMDLPRSRLIGIQPNLDNNKYPNIPKLDNIEQDNLQHLLDAAEQAKNDKEYQLVVELLKKY